MKALPGAAVKKRAGLNKIWAICGGARVKTLFLASMDSKHLWAVATAATTPAATPPGATPPGATPAGMWGAGGFCSVITPDDALCVGELSRAAMVPEACW